MIAEGWLRKGRKWICPACVAYAETLTPCPKCGHELRGHIEDGTGKGDRYYCADYNSGEYCDCKRAPVAVEVSA